MKENSINFKVTTNTISSTYEFTAVDKTTSQVTQVNVNYNPTTQKLTWNDVMQSTKEEVITVTPTVKPAVIVPVEQFTQPALTKIIEFVKN